ncbi:MAG: galactokinase [Phycisphaeraceae bacterium]|nr:galactokinase [Phycisphaeraceae bacterium]
MSRFAPETAVDRTHQARGVVDLFRQRFESNPAAVAAAPGRVNLIGEHTDYNDGFVLPMAIERQAVIAAAPGEPGRYRVVSTEMGEVELRPGQSAQEVSGWSAYVMGVIVGLKEAGIELEGLNAVIDSTVPTGGGLSSSAALEVSVATVAEQLAGVALSVEKKALLCQKAEHDYANVPCGVMDQFISAGARAGAAMLLDCRSLERRAVELADPSVAILIIDSAVRHELADGAYADRRAACERAAEALGVKALRDATLEMIDAADLDETDARRARHVVGENKRTVEAAEALASSNWSAAGRAMNASHDSLRDDYEVSCDEVDHLVAATRGRGESGGVYGARMTGGGFGGCMVALVQADRAPEIAEAVLEDYESTLGITGRCFVSQPAAGAGPVEGVDL